MFRPNLQNEEHRRAWEILQAVPEGQKNAFLVQVILENAQREELETILRRVLQEELKAVPSQPVPVSYTHLDVYKRQPMIRLSLEEACTTAS